MFSYIWIWCIFITLNSDSYLPKKLFYLLQWQPFKDDGKKLFYFCSKVLFVLKIFKFLSRICSHVEEKQTAWNFRLLNQRYAQFWFLERGMIIVSPSQFVNDFLGKMFLILYSLNWPSFIVWWPLLHETLGNMCFAIVCFSGCDVINFEVNFIFLIMKI